MSLKLQQEHETVDRSIASELISLIPEHWEKVSLELELSQEDNYEKIAHSIRSLEGYREIVWPSDELFKAAYELSIAPQKSWIFLEKSHLHHFIYFRRRLLGL